MLFDAQLCLDSVVASCLHLEGWVAASLQAVQMTQ